MSIESGSSEIYQLGDIINFRADDYVYQSLDDREDNNIDLSSEAGNQGLGYYLRSGQGDDKLTGSEWDDAIIGGRGDDEIDGGDGFDTVVFDDEIESYIVEFLDDGTIRVTDIVGGEGTDLIKNVEKSVDQQIRDIIKSHRGANLTFAHVTNANPELAKSLIQQLGKYSRNRSGLGNAPVVVTSTDIRSNVRSILLSQGINLSVLSHNELAEEISIQPIRVLQHQVKRIRRKSLQDPEARAMAIRERAVSSSA